MRSGSERCWKRPSPAASASTPAPHSTTSCSTSVPAEVTRCLRCDRARADADVTFTSVWRAASSARRQSSILSASETANGSRSTWVAYEPEAGSTGARLRPFRVGVARANPVARAAASRAPDSSSRLEQAKPQAPSTSTRTPMPSLSASSSVSTRPFFVDTCWPRSTTARASAYSAPAARAASTASWQMSRTRPNPNGALHCRPPRWWRNW